MLFTSIAKLTPEVGSPVFHHLHITHIYSAFFKFKDIKINYLFLFHQAANPFFKLLTMLMEFAGGPPGMPSFASYILQRIWEVLLSLTHSN